MNECNSCVQWMECIEFQSQFKITLSCLRNKRDTQPISFRLPCHAKFYTIEYRRLIRLRVRILCGTKCTLQHITAKESFYQNIRLVSGLILNFSSTPSYQRYVYELHDSTNEFANDVNPLDPFDCFGANCVWSILSQQPSIIDPQKRIFISF